MYHNFQIQGSGKKKSVNYANKYSKSFEKNGSQGYAFKTVISSFDDIS
jgi:hypothetical protein